MRQHRKTALLFLAPFLTVFVAFYLTPVVYAIYLSLFIRKRVGIGPAKEVFGGLANYIRAVQDGDFLNGLKNMFVFGVVQVPVMLGLAILLALLLAESRGVFMKVCRTAFFMPYGIPSAIGALIWGYLYSPNLSPFNQVLAAFHAGAIQFLSPGAVLFSIANIVTWTWTGYNMITLFAALQNIPNELYEAARVDGATQVGHRAFHQDPVADAHAEAVVHFLGHRHLATLYRSLRAAPAWLRGRQHHPQSLPLPDRRARRQLLVRRSLGHPAGAPHLCHQRPFPAPHQFPVTDFTTLMAIKQPSAQAEPGGGDCARWAPGNVIAPPPSASRADAGTSPVSSVLRNVVLGAFLLYCLLPATWIIAAMTKDNGQIFSTFGLWFASPLHFFENLGRPVYLSERDFSALVWQLADLRRLHHAGQHAHLRHGRLCLFQVRFSRQAASV